MRRLHCCLMMLLAALSVPAGGEIRVAVAANFAHTAEQLAERFARQNGCRVEIISGATGTLAAQIQQGAPFDAFLAADAERPARLEQAGRLVPGSRFTYALGVLVLWTPRDRAGPAWLRVPGQRLAIPNERLAPYGRAALDVLNALGLGSDDGPLLIRGASVGQTYHFVDSGAAPGGFVALAQVRARRQRDARACEGQGGGPAGAGRVAGTEADETRHVWRPPADTYEPLLQQAGRVVNAAPASAAFLDFLASEEARRLIAAAGYTLPQHASAASP